MRPQKWPARWNLGGASPSVPPPHRADEGLEGRALRQETVAGPAALFPFPLRKRFEWQDPAAPRARDEWFRGKGVYDTAIRKGISISTSVSGRAARDHRNRDSSWQLNLIDACLICPGRPVPLLLGW